MRDDTSTPSGGAFSLCVATGATVLCAWLSLFPAIIHGLAGIVPQADVPAFFGGIAEMQPIQLTAKGIGLLLPGTLATIAALCLAWRTRNLIWTYAGSCGCAVVVLAQSHIRFLGYSDAMAALMLPVVLERLTSSPISVRSNAMVRLSVIIGFLVLPKMLILLSHKDGPKAELTANCHVNDIRPALLKVQNAVVLTEFNDAPELLWRTEVRTVGSLYHRGIAAFMLARNAWRSGPSQTAPGTVLATGATYILACDTNGRPSFVADLPPSILQNRLSRHGVPAWLHEVSHAGGYHLYSIDRGLRANSDQR